MGGLRAVEHGALVAVETPARAGQFGAQADIRRIAARVRLLPGEHRQNVASDQARQQECFQIGIAALSDRLTGQPDHAEIGLDHQRAVETPHQPERAGDGTAQTAVVFGKGNAQPAEFRELLPVRR